MTTRRAFTLIELLIVVTIIMIGSAVSLFLVVGPMREHNRATLEHGMRAGLNRASAKLVEDLRHASEVIEVEPGRAYRVANACYYVDAKSNLRRLPISTGGGDSLQIQMQRGLGVELGGPIDVLRIERPEPDGPFARVRIAAREDFFKQPLTVTTDFTTRMALYGGTP